MIPTFNEAENIEPLIREIEALPLSGGLHVLVVDDDSPDGTGELVQKLAAADPRVASPAPQEEAGTRGGGIDGFKAALALGADYIVEMDGDFPINRASSPLLSGKWSDATSPSAPVSSAAERIPTGASSAGRSPGSPGVSSGAASGRRSATCRPVSAVSAGAFWSGWIRMISSPRPVDRPGNPVQADPLGRIDS